MPQIASDAIRNARMKLDVGGIDGIAIPANSVISGSWSKIGGGFINFNHNVLSNQSAHRVYGAPAYLSATNPASLTEATLNGATVTVSLGGLTYASGVSASSFALVANPAIAGLSIGNVTGGASGATTATLTLATGAGYGFNTPATLAVRVRAAAHSGSPDLTSGTLAVSPTPGVTLSRRSLVLEEDPGTTNAHPGGVHGGAGQPAHAGRDGDDCQCGHGRGHPRRHRRGRHERHPGHPDLHGGRLGHGRDPDLHGQLEPCEPGAGDGGVCGRGDGDGDCRRRRGRGGGLRDHSRRGP